MIPYGDPAWYQGYHSPYYNESHVALRQEIRAWIEEKIEPNLNEWEKAKSVPEEIYREMGTRGYLAGYFLLPADLIGALFQSSNFVLVSSVSAALRNTHHTRSPPSQQINGITFTNLC